MIISISGTPGVGKTYIAKKLAKLSKGKLEYFDLNKYIKDNKIYDSYDSKAKTYDVDIDLLKKIINPTLKKHKSKNNNLDKMVGKIFDSKEFINKISKNNFEGIIVDSHLSHYLECDYCIIVRCETKKLYNRLKLRKYSKQKIRDNIDAEIFQVCLDEARIQNLKVIQVNN